MRPFTTSRRRAAHPQPNFDTDQIIPARYLKSRARTTSVDYLFHDLRYRKDGNGESGVPAEPPAYRDARIVVAERNFGCGSSREHAVWALYDYGFRAVIAPSFGDIFQSNALKNGLLPVVLPGRRGRSACWPPAEESPGSTVGIDLEAQTVTAPDGSVHPSTSIRSRGTVCWTGSTSSTTP